jgi:hypothetical protein
MCAEFSNMNTSFEISQTRTLQVLLASRMNAATCPTHLIRLALMTVLIFGNISLWNVLPSSVTLSCLG